MFKSGSKLHWIKNLYLRYIEGAGCCDIYSGYHYLSKKILPVLTGLKKRKVSYPSRLNSMEEWIDILDKMIWSFEEIIKDENYVFYNEEGKIDCDKTNSYNNKIQTGLDLFAKYFQCLWY